MSGLLMNALIKIVCDFIWEGKGMKLCRHNSFHHWLEEARGWFEIDGWNVTLWVEGFFKAIH